MTRHAIPIERTAAARETPEALSVAASKSTAPGAEASVLNVRPDRSRPLGPQIYTVLRRAIVRGMFDQNEPIDERRIAAELGVSRTPVREAVRRLVDERLVDVVAQSSTRVAPLDLGLLEESRLIRRTLEMESAAQAAPRMTARHATALKDTIRLQRKCIDEERFGDAIEVDDEFHHAIASISGLERLWRTIELEKAHVDRCRHRMLPLPGEAETTLIHHGRIIEALCSGDAARARAAMAAHLDTAWETTRQAVARDQDGGHSP